MTFQSWKPTSGNIRSREVLVVDSLDSRLADQIARCRARKGFSENFVLRHLPDVTQHVRSQASMAVVSSRLGSQLNLRMLPLVRSEEHTSELQSLTNLV